MNTQPFFPEAQLHIPFTLKGYPGSVEVYYGPNADVCKAGFDALPGIDFPIELCQGYPAMHALIDNYAGSGYRTLCAWIQIITRETIATTDVDRTNPRISSGIDVPPAMRESGIPFAVFGNLPSLFDAPCRNLGDNAELIWTADTFLTTVPLRSRQTEISWLLGFRWGYREYDNPAVKPVTLLPLEITDPHVWNSHLPFLRREFESWRFKEA